MDNIEQAQAQLVGGAREPRPLDDEEDVVPFEGPDREALAELARTMSVHTDYGSVPAEEGFQNPFDGSANNPELDPASPDFNTRAWVKNLHQLFITDPQRFPRANLGVVFRDLNVYGDGADANFQVTVGTGPLALFKGLKSATGAGKTRVDILQPMNGFLKPSEMLLVLGRPGSGCSTFLRTMAQQTFGFNVNKDSYINYSGVPPDALARQYRGAITYSAESELHFPQLSVGDTLMFVARLKTPANRVENVAIDTHARHMRDMIMATFGLSHTVNTRVGNDYVRGVSGGERKRVSIAELVLCNAAFQCWDNSTRGLDSATALEFVRSVKIGCDYFNVTALIAIYQASEEMYNQFDKTIVLYEGRQIYYGPVDRARQFFIDMGWEPKPRQPTPDFLTSLSSPNEREARKGFEDKVPRTAEEFEQRWRDSDLYAEMMRDLNAYDEEFPLKGKSWEEFRTYYNSAQSKRLPKNVAYTVSFWRQTYSLMLRGFQRTKGDPTMTLSTIIGNSVLGLLVASMFYNLPRDTDSFYYRTSLLFFSVLFNTMNSLLEIFALFQARAIVQKHHQYALYHPAIDAVASIITELPTKLITGLLFNFAVYFLPNLWRNAGNFFFFLLVSFTTTLCMSHAFRTIGSVTKTFEEAMIPGNVMLLAFILFTGFVIPTRNMHLWCRWINYIDPVAYSFEALIDNEFHGHEYPCSTYAPSGPGYENVGGVNRVCAVTGAKAGQEFINGDQYIGAAYRYYESHKWRNWGIIVGFMLFFLFTYMLCVWLNPGQRTKGEVLVYPWRDLRKRMKAYKRGDAESGSTDTVAAGLAAKSSDRDPNGEEEKELIEASTDIFYWKDLCYDIKIKGEPRRLLNYVDGWVKPGTLTALMGSSGAGKTTLLDTLANRVTMGEVTGHVYVNGIPRDETFQRSTGYAMQQDLHLETATVRESLVFSALMRQPHSTPHKEKLAYVDNVLKILEMEPYADAVVGIIGEGLNVEQRKRLTIGVELAAKPKLLLFLDEPTSGLDSQTAWSICQLLKKLSNAGQAILCTIHQPSALLFQQFDRLLFLAKGGKTVYFGEIGENSKTLTSYFEKHGAEPIGSEANPAEWMLHVIGAAPGSHANHDYAEVWLHSEERQAVRNEINSLMQQFGASETNVDPESAKAGEFATPIWFQYLLVSRRTFQQQWRSPLYIYSKIFLTIFSAIFNGFVFFKMDQSVQGTQDLMFSVFMFAPILNSIIQQYLPGFVKQRTQYEARERPSKMFSWQAFLIGQITAEIPWQAFSAVLAFLCWYYPIGLYNVAKVNDAVTERSGLMFFYILFYYFYAVTLGQLIIAGMPDADSATNVCVMLFSMSLMFCGVLVKPQNMPRFWIFMYRVSPMTYWLTGMVGTAIGHAKVQCREYEFLQIVPLEGQTCGEYLGPYLKATDSYVKDPSATDICNYCQQATTDLFLEGIHAPYRWRWRNLLIFMAYIFINVIGCIIIYYVARVPKSSSRMKASEVRDLNYDPALDSNNQPPPPPPEKKEEDGDAQGSGASSDGTAAAQSPAAKSTAPAPAATSANRNTAAPAPAAATYTPGRPRAPSQASSVISRVTGVLSDVSSVTVDGEHDRW